MGGTLELAQERVLPFLPRLVAQWLADQPGHTWREVDASLVFVDISGFTKLSEKLARQGKIGAEELTDAIGTCFESLLHIAYANGAGLLKFGGDALLLLFPGVDHAARATRSAWHMRAALADLVSRGETPVRLRMSVGVHSGTVTLFLVGSSHRELLVTGPAASETVRMETAAEAGEIVISSATAAALSPDVVGVAKGPGWLLRREPGSVAPGGSQLPLPRPGVDLAHGVSTALRDLVLEGIDEPEHKRVTVGFLHYDLRWMDDPKLAAESLDALVRVAQEAAERQGICFLGTDIDLDGGKIILTAGAPVATGADEERMLLACREIIEAPQPLPIRIGVNVGHVFAGNIGPTYRRTYTVMGDAVNLAARVMSKSEPGQVLATDIVLENSRTRFATTGVEPFMVKGKSAPVRAQLVGARIGITEDSPRIETALIGRGQELAVLTQALSSATDARGRMVELVGEPGVGKSRLVEELKSVAGGLTVLATSGQFYETLTPYYPLRKLLRAAIGLAGDVDAAELKAALPTYLRKHAPALVPWLPLLAIPFGIEVPSTPEVDELSEAFRRPKLEEAVSELLRVALTEPTLIVIEDTHWVDEATAELLRRLAHDLGNRPCLVVLTRRDLDTGFLAPTLPAVEVLRLAPLDEAASIELVDAVAAASPLAAHEVKAIAARSGGNPLFLAELVAAAQAAGGVEALPDSVEGVIMSRIDRLTPSDRSLLRRLSVLGTTSNRSLAHAVFPDLPNADDEVWRRLGEFVAAEDGALRFRQTLVRDGAYESLPFRRRRDLHGLVGETLERISAGDIDAAAGSLSLHFFHAGEYSRAWRYSRIAAERARTVYANIEAADFYQRALDAARRDGSVSGPEISLVSEALGDVRRRTGAFKAAGEAYRLARQAAGADELAQARLLLKQGRARQNIGAFEQARRWFRRAEQTTTNLEPLVAERLRAEIAVARASLAKDEGRWADVYKWCKRAVPIAESSGDNETLGHALYLLDASLVALGNWEEAGYAERALELYTELGDLWEQAGILNNLGYRAFLRGDWDETVSLAERARDAFERVGDDVSAAFAAMNVGEIRSDQGRLEEAEPLLRRALRVRQAAGDQVGVAMASSHLGRLAARKGAYEEARVLLYRAQTGFREAGAEGEAREVDARVAECLLLEGRAVEALADIESSLRQDASRNAPGIQTATLHRLAGYAYIQIGDYDTARMHLEDSYQAAKERRSEYEMALARRAQARLADFLDEALPEAWAECKAILDRLGIVQVCEPPLIHSITPVGVNVRLPADEDELVAG